MSLSRIFAALRVALARPGAARRLGGSLLWSLGVVLPVDRAPAPRETAIFSAGCYWTVEAVFEHTRGVTNVEAGLAGREVAANGYARNTTATVGLAEAVRVTYDPLQVTYEELLRVFFSAAHDPTTVNRQGPDAGARYRSVLWFSNDKQQKAALAEIARLEASGTFAAPVVTQVARAGTFTRVAEEEQDFVAKYPDHPYVVAWDRPRIARFKASLPGLYRDRR